MIFDILKTRQYSPLIFAALEKQRERELRKEKDEMNEDKNKVAVMYSERKKRLQTASRRLLTSDQSVIFTCRQQEEERISPQEEESGAYKNYYHRCGRGGN